MSPELANTDSFLLNYNIITLYHYRYWISCAQFLSAYKDCAQIIFPTRSKLIRCPSFAWYLIDNFSRKFPDKGKEKMFVDSRWYACILFESTLTRIKLSIYYSPTSLSFDNSFLSMYPCQCVLTYPLQNHSHHWNTLEMCMLQYLWKLFPRSQLSVSHSR